MIVDLVSIIIPVYNVGDFLGKCLESVIFQTYKNIEVILVDDGSTDSSGLVCDQYAEKYGFITVIHKKNGGLSSARNAGLDISSGKYVIFVDSDDIVSKDMVEMLHRLVVDQNADIGICDIIHCYPSKEICFTPADKTIVFTAEEAISEMLYQKSFLVTVCGKIFPKDYFTSIRFPVGILYEDSATTYKVFDKANKIVYSNARVYGYFHRENSITTGKFTLRDCDILKICEDIDQYFMNRREGLKKAAMSYHASAAFRIIMNAPDDNLYSVYKSECDRYIGEHYHELLNDLNIRRKLRMALVLYRYFKPFMKMVYAKVNRWS